MDVSRSVIPSLAALGLFALAACSGASAPSGRGTAPSAAGAAQPGSGAGAGTGAGSGGGAAPKPIAPTPPAPPAPPTPPTPPAPPATPPPAPTPPTPPTPPPPPPPPPPAAPPTQNPAPAGHTPILLVPNVPAEIQPYEWKDTFATRGEGFYYEYEVDLQAGVSYRITTRSATSGGSAPPFASIFGQTGAWTPDTYLYLLDVGRALLAEDDDSAGNHHAEIRFTPTVSGQYYVRLRAQLKGAYGSCTIELVQ